MGRHYNAMRASRSQTMRSPRPSRSLVETAEEWLEARERLREVLAPYDEQVAVDEPLDLP
jgi:hypothetical protein